MARRSRARTPESHTLPEPEGPDEVYRGFESLNRRRGRGLPGLAGLSGRKAPYGLFAVTEVAAIALGFFLEVPFMDSLAIVLPGLLVLVHGGPKEAEQERPDGKEGGPAAREDPETPLGAFLERLLRRFGDPGSPVR